MAHCDSVQLTPNVFLSPVVVLLYPTSLAVKLSLNPYKITNVSYCSVLVLLLIVIVNVFVELACTISFTFKEIFTLTLLFVLIMRVVTYIKLKKIDLIEPLKSVE